MDSTTQRAMSFWRSLFAILLVTACGGDKLTQVVLDPASIVLDLNTVAFAVMAGDPDPNPTSVRISNGGDRALSGLSATVDYAAGQPSGWLSAALDAASAPANLSLAPSTGGLPPGTYSAEVGVSAAGIGPKMITVALTVQPAPGTPWISLPTSRVDVVAVEGAPNPGRWDLLITNGGGGTLDGLGAGVRYRPGEATGWLSATLSGDVAPTILRISTTSSLTEGTYYGMVDLTSGAAGNSPATVEVYLEVKPPGPAISLSASSVSFSADEGGADPAPSAVVIRNGGTGTLGSLSASVRYSPAGPANWLTVSLDRGTAPDTVTIVPRVGSLPAGNYEAKVIIDSPESGNGAQMIDVSFTVRPLVPVVELSHDRLTFGAMEGGQNPVARSVGVTNGGGGSLTGLTTDIAFGVGQPTGWLSAFLSGTSAPSSLKVSAETGSLPQGSYSARITVASTVAGNPSASIDVTFDIGAGLADLRVGSPLTTNSPVETGADVDLPSMTYRNQGTDAASSFRVGYYLSSDAIIDSSDLLLGSTSISGIGADSDIQVAAGSVRIPAGTAPGDYYFGVIMDDLEAVTESDESNNTAQTPVTVVAGAPASYTLTVTQSPATGGRVTRSPSAASYAAGTVVTLTAVSNTGYDFAAWTGDASTTSPTTTVTMTRDMTVTANFAIVQPELSGSAQSQDVNLSWTFDWPCDIPFGRGCLASSQDRYELEESTTSSKSGFATAFVSNSTRQSPFSYTLQRPAGTYYYRVRAFGSAWVSPYSDVIAVTVSAQPTPPAAPTNLSAVVSGTTIDVSWIDNASDETEYRLEVSNSSTFSTFDRYDLPANATFRRFTQVAPGTYYMRVFAVNGVGPSGPSNTVTATVAAPPSLARFVNNTVYPVYTILINGVEQVPSGQALLPGDTYELEMAPGSHSFYMGNGAWDNGWFGLYNFSGTFTQPSGQTVETVFNDPTVQQLMTRFQSSQYWDGDYVDSGGNFHLTTLRFDSNGAWTLYIDGNFANSGSYGLVARNPGGFNVEISLLSGVNGTLWETLGFFSTAMEPGIIAQFYPR